MFSHLHPFPQLVGGYMLELSITRRHVRQANVLFADGHIGSESLRQMLYPSVENWAWFNYNKSPTLG